MSELQQLKKRIADLEIELDKWRRMCYETEKKVGIGSYKINLETYNVEWSVGLKDIFNLKKTDSPPSIDSYYSYVHPDDVAGVKNMFDKCVAHGTLFEMEYRIILSDNTLKYVHSKGEIKLNDKGEKCLFGYFKDISLHKKQEIELYQFLNNGKEPVENDKTFLKIRFQAEIWNMVDLGIITTNSEGKVVYINPGAERLYGWKEEEVLGNYPNNIFSSPDMEAQGAEIMAELMKGNSWGGEFLVQKKGGEKFWAKITDMPIMDDKGKLIGIIGISEDITERKNLYNSIEQSEIKYRLLVENASMGILILKEDKILFANKFFANLCEVNIETIQNNSIYKFLIDEDRIIIKSYLEYSKKVKSFNPTILALRFEGGNKKLIHTEATLIHTSDEKNEKLIQMIVSDVTHMVELKKKSKYIFTDAIYMSRKLSRFSEINSKLEGIVIKNRLNKNEFKDIFHVLNEERNLEQLWSIFQNNFEHIFPDFFKKLLEKAPTLTQQEMKHCAFIKLCFETKEIALLFNVKPSTIQMGRVRIKKKLKMEHTDDLTTFIHLL